MTGTQQSQPTPIEIPIKARYTSGIPFFGPLFIVKKDVLKFFEDLFADYGDIVSYKVFGDETIATANPGLAEHVVNSADYRKIDNNRRFIRAIGDGLITSEGERWIKQRRVVKPLFSTHTLEAHFFEQLRTTALDTRRRWLELTKDGPAAINVGAEMNRIAFNSSIGTIFGKCSLDTEETTELFNSYIVMASYLEKLPIKSWLDFRRIFFTTSYRRFRKARRYTRDILERLVEEHLQNRDTVSRDDLLIEHLLSALEDGSGFDKDDFDANLSTMLFASTITTALLLQWMWIVFDQNAEVLASILAEIKSAHMEQNCLDQEDFLSHGHFKHMHNLHASIKEVLRLYPPFWILARKALKDDMYKGLLIPKGTVVLVFPLFLHRSPHYWESPNNFDHTRFLDHHEDSLPKGVYMPFGTGRRQCPASRMSILEAAVVAADLLPHFDVSIVNNTSNGISPTLFLNMRYPVKAVIKRRQ